MKTDKILYFGYGAHTSPKLMEVLLGRKVYGRKALLQNYGLFVTNWNLIPEEAQGALRGSWGKSFSHYSIKMHRGDVVWGKLYKITEKEREVIAKWNLFEEGMFTPIKVLVNSKGREFLAETETFLTSSPKIFYSNSAEASVFLNKKGRMLDIAKQIHDLSIRV